MVPVSEDYEDVSGDNANLVVATRTYKPLRTGMAEVKTSANAAVDRMQGPVDLGPGRVVIGNKNAIRREKKTMNVEARLDLLEHRLLRLDIIDKEMESLRPTVQAIRMGFLEMIKRNAIRNGKLGRNLVGPWCNEVIEERHHHAHCGDALQDLQLYLKGIRDDGKGALYTYVYGIPTSEVLVYKGTSTLPLPLYLTNPLLDIPEIIQVLSWRGELVGCPNGLPASFEPPFSKLIELARQSDSLKTDIHQKPMISLFRELKAIYNGHKIPPYRYPPPSPTRTSLASRISPTVLRRFSLTKRNHLPTATLAGYNSIPKEARAFPA